WSRFERRRAVAAAAEDDVPRVAERPFRRRRPEVEPGDEQRPRPRIAHRVEDRIEREEGIAREVHLRDEALRESTAEDREVDVRGTPGVLVVAPRIRARLDGDEAV